MKLPFLQVLNRITGISTPIFGVSWTPPNLDVEAAKRLLTYFEDRRVLFNPYELETPRYVVQSILTIRERLTNELEQLDRSSPIAQSIVAMRAACRKFLDEVERSDIEYDRSIRNRLGSLDGWIFLSALGEMRGVFGIHVAQISVQYGIDIEEHLAVILPSLPDKD